MDGELTYALMKLPKMSRLKASNRRFSNYAPEAWNSIPKELRSIADATAFKGKLKNYLYGCNYNKVFMSVHPVTT